MLLKASGDSHECLSPLVGEAASAGAWTDKHDKSLLYILGSSHAGLRFQHARWTNSTKKVRVVESEPSTGRTCLYVPYMQHLLALLCTAPRQHTLKRLVESRTHRTLTWRLNADKNKIQAESTHVKTLVEALHMPSTTETIEWEFPWQCEAQEASKRSSSKTASASLTFNFRRLSSNDPDMILIGISPCCSGFNVYFHIAPCRTHHIPLLGKHLSPVMLVLRLSWSFPSLAAHPARPSSFMFSESSSATPWMWRWMRASSLGTSGHELSPPLVYIQQDIPFSI